jgi:hypothetical protein
MGEFEEEGLIGGKIHEAGITTDHAEYTEKVWVRIFCVFRVFRG